MLDHSAQRSHLSETGMVVVAGERRATAFGPRGRQLWNRNLAPGDSLVGLGTACLHLRLAGTETITAVRANGATAWERQVRGNVTTMPDGTLLAVDAASVRAISCRTGREEWLFAPDMQRSLRLMSTIDESVVLLGETGDRRTLFVLGPQGRLVRSVPLPALTTSVHPLRDDRILAVAPESLTMLDAHGHEIWSRRIPASGEVLVAAGTTTVVESAGDARVSCRVLGPDGAATASCAFDDSAEAVAVRILRGAPGAALIAACVGPLSSCADTTMSRGPYNRLWACGPEGGRRAAVPSGDEPYFETGFDGRGRVAMVATHDSRSVALYQIDSTLELRIVSELPGRRMLGPSPGPEGNWLVATCTGPRCEAPFRLFAVPIDEGEG